MQDFGVGRSPGFQANSLDLGAFYQTIFDQPEFAVYIIRVGLDGSFLFEDANDGVATLANRPLSDIRQKTPRDCLPAEIAECLETNLRRCLESGRNLTYARSIDLPDGRMSWKTSLIPVAQSFDAVRHVVGLTRDITYETERLNSAVYNEALLEGLGAAMPNAIYLYNVRTRTIRFIGGQVSRKGRNGGRVPKRPAALPDCCSSTPMITRKPKRICRISQRSRTERLALSIIAYSTCTGNIAAT